MIEFLELSILPIFLLLPLVAVFLALILPHSDRITLYYIALLSTMLGLLVAVEALFVLNSSDAGLHLIIFPPWQSFSMSLYMDFLSWPLIFLIYLVSLLCLYADRRHFHANNKQRIVWLLCFDFLAILAVLVEDSMFSLMAFALATYVLILFHVLYGEKSRGSTGFQLITVFLFVDLLSASALVFLDVDYKMILAEVELTYLSQAWLNRLLFSALALSSIARIMLFPFSDYFIRFFDESPLNVRLLYQGIIIPLASYLLMRWVMIPYDEYAPLIFTPVILIACMSILLSFLYVLSLKSLRHFKNHVLISSLALSTIGLCSSSTKVMLLAYLAIISVSFSSLVGVYVLEMIEVYFKTIQISDLQGLKKSFPALWKMYFLATAMLLGFPFMGFGFFFPDLLIQLLSLEALDVLFSSSVYSLLLPLSIIVVFGSYTVFFVNHLSLMMVVPQYSLYHLKKIPASKYLTLMILFALSMTLAPLLSGYASIEKLEVTIILNNFPAKLR